MDYAQVGGDKAVIKVLSKSVASNLTRLASCASVSISKEVTR